MNGPRIIISPGLWGRRVDEQVDPPRADVPLRTFASHGLASAYAYQLSAARGWRAVDQAQPAEWEA